MVIHRLWKGRHGAGPNYISNPTKRHPETKKVIPRYVSWHYTVHTPGWNRMLTQHASILTHCHHAPPLNGTSCGVELDGPYGGLWHYESMDVTVDLIKHLQTQLPALRRLVAHRWVSPATRKDPGPNFPWDRFAGLGLEIVE